MRTNPDRFTSPRANSLASSHRGDQGPDAMSSNMINTPVARTTNLSLFQNS